MSRFTGCFTGLLLLVFLSAGTFAMAQDAAQPNAPAEEDCFTKYMKVFNVSYTIGSVTPTVCELNGVEKPTKSSAPVVTPVVDIAKEKLNGRKVQRTLIFSGDAIGDVLIQAFPDDFAKVREITDYTALCSNVMQSVTPVCFSSIFTGAPPEVHGIRVYERPVQRTDTLFDAFARAGKNVAIVAENHCSVDLIFRERKVDYYSFRTNEQSFQCAMKLIADSDYDLIICYDGGYDSQMHKTGVHSPEALQAMRDSIRRFVALVAQTDKYWGDKDRLALFISDHGSHDNANGKGTHGTEMKEDMLMDHFYRVRAAKPTE